MSNVYALVKDGEVKNTIIANDSFISAIQSNWDHCVRIDQLTVPSKWTKDGEADVTEDPRDESWTYVPGTNMPSIGWSYDGSSFTAPEEE